MLDGPFIYQYAPETRARVRLVRRVGLVFGVGSLLAPVLALASFALFSGGLLLLPLIVLSLAFPLCWVVLLKKAGSLLRSGPLLDSRLEFAAPRLRWLSADGQELGWIDTAKPFDLMRLDQSADAALYEVVQPDGQGGARSVSFCTVIGGAEHLLTRALKQPDSLAILAGDARAY